MEVIIFISFIGMGIAGYYMIKKLVQFLNE